MDNVIAKYPKLSFWIVVIITTAACWGARLIFWSNGVWNAGVAFSWMLPTNLIYGLSGAILGGVCGYFMRLNRPMPYLVWGLGLVVGGGLANLIDRVAHHGQVLDYIPFIGIGHFNLADVLVGVGIMIVLYYWWQNDNVQA